MTVSTRNTRAIVDEATRQSLNDLVHELVNTAVDNIADNCKVNLVSIHLFDLALMWHRQFVKFIGDDVDWNVYRGAILKRFDVAYDDPLGEVKKLKQTSTMQEYIDAFDRLLCIINLEKDQCISFFLAGLSSEIELVVRMFKPSTLAKVYRLHKLDEAKVNAIKQRPKQPILPTPRYQNQFPNTGPKPMALSAPNANWRTKPVNSSSFAPLRKQLTQKELEEKRAKNQCFYCDQRYTPGYKCSGQVFSFEVLGDDSQELTDTEHEGETSRELIEETKELIQYSPHISLNAINGTNTYQTMRICGNVGGCEIVLGIQWLSTLGNILTNFKELRMEFKYKGRKVLLRGISKAIESQQVPGKITELLHQYTNVFSIPTTLPPKRPFDHRIPLKEGTILINSRPYRHPPTQKDTVEVMVKELLDIGVIKDSQSPFSSPVVMVNDDIK
ncbi:retrotransposable element Tf2 [Tanacetum coccineum]